MRAQVFRSPVVVLAAVSLACSVAACGSESTGVAAAPPASPQSDGGAAAPLAPSDVDASDAASSTVDAPPKEAPPGCDGSQLPTQNACVVDDGLAIFVSKSLGNDASGDGTRAKPFATIQKGITAASATGRRVYACAESYTESVVLAEGVSVFGYFDCANAWSVVTTKHATLTGTTNPTIKASGLTAPLRVDGFDVEAPAASGASASSIAMIVADVQSIVIANGSLVAKDATAGADGTAATQLQNAGIGVDGKDGAVPGICTLAGLACPSIYGGGPGGANACQGASGIVGGPGGHGGFGGKYSKLGATFSKLQSPTDGEGGTAQTAAGGTSISSAADGAPGADGANGTSSQGGVITKDGFTPGNGTNGANGAPGQGGGGGRGWGMTATDATSDSASWYGYSGAGGGAGGCPGLAGTAGKGGGSSIALISWNSGVRLDTVTVRSGNGGDGGKGAIGSAATAGGVGSAFPTQHFQAKGGHGGFGGHSGWSGHGAGGSSIGVAYKGTAPDLGGATPTLGKAGKGQAAKVVTEVPSFGKTIPASADGIAQGLWSIP